MSTVMFRKTTCQKCGYVQTTFTSYRQDRSLWENLHSKSWCETRQNHPAIRSKMSVA